MQYKLKNITSETFTFEGITIPADEVSEELSPAIYQRLLAIYYGTTLLPIDDPSYMNASPEKTDTATSQTSETNEPEKPKEPEKFICSVCQKEFKSNRGLSAHVRFAHKKVEIN